MVGVDLLVLGHEFLSRGPRRLCEASCLQFGGRMFAACGTLPRRELPPRGGGPLRDGEASDHESAGLETRFSQRGSAPTSSIRDHAAARGRSAAGRMPVPAEALLAIE